MMHHTLIQPESAARNLLRELKVKSIEDLWDIELLAYYRNALVRYARLDGAEARLSAVGRKAIITVSDKPTNLARKRFSIAHELGHFEIHCLDDGLEICTGRDIDIWNKGAQSREQEANIFASAFLMPQPFFEPLCNQEIPSLDLIAQLSVHFRTSLTATALRYSYFCSEPVAVIYSQNGRAQWFKSNQPFSELGVYIETRARLDERTFAARSLDASRYYVPGKVPALAWFAKGSYRRDATIVEHSWPLQPYDGVLTLLWVDDDLYDEQDEFLWG